MGHINFQVATGLIGFDAKDLHEIAVNFLVRSQIDLDRLRPLTYPVKEGLYRVIIRNCALMQLKHGRDEVDGVPLQGSLEDDRSFPDLLFYERPLICPLQVEDAPLLLL